MATKRTAGNLLTFTIMLLVLCASLAMLTLLRGEGAGGQLIVNQGNSLSQKPASHAIAADDFITVDGLWLRDGRGRPHFVQGMNYWSCMNLGASDEAGGDIQRLATELDQLAAVGINHLRIVAASEGSERRAPFRILPALQHLPGQWDERIFAGLDKCVAEAGRRGIRLTLVMGNTWQWTGGNAQVYAWSRSVENVPFPRSWNLSAPPQRADQLVGWGDWEAGHDQDFEEYARLFYTDARSIEIYKAHLEKVITRRNSITGRLYSEDATIMAWEPINEPQLSGGPSETDAMVVWHNDIAAYIKARAPRQLLTTGFEAKQGAEAYKSLHKSKDVDYGCAHMWPQIWGHYDMLDPSKANVDQAINWTRTYILEVEGYAREMGKPILLEEFGMPRDNWHNNVSAGQYLYDCSAPTTSRDAVFAAVFALVGAHFKQKSGLIGLAPWSYGGVYRSATQQYNNQGMVLAGDPPQEPPCWFSILDHDHAMALLADMHQDMTRFLDALL